MRKSLLLICLLFFALAAAAKDKHKSKGGSAYCFRRIPLELSGLSPGSSSCDVYWEAGVQDGADHLTAAFDDTSSIVVIPPGRESCEVLEREFAKRDSLSRIERPDWAPASGDSRWYQSLNVIRGCTESSRGSFLVIFTENGVTRPMVAAIVEEILIYGPPAGPPPPVAVKDPSAMPVSPTQSASVETQFAVPVPGTGELRLQLSATRLSILVPPDVAKFNWSTTKAQEGDLIQASDSKGKQLTFQVFILRQPNCDKGGRGWPVWLDGNASGPPPYVPPAPASWWYFNSSAGTQFGCVQNATSAYIVFIPREGIWDWGTMLTAVMRAIAEAKPSTGM